MKYFATEEHKNWFLACALSKNSIQELFKLITQEVSKSFTMDNLNIMFLDEAKTGLIVEWAKYSKEYQALEKTNLNNRHPIFEDSEFRQCIEENKTIRLYKSDIIKDNYIKYVFDVRNVETACLFPLSDNKTIGLIFIYNWNDEIDNGCIELIKYLISLLYDHIKQVYDYKVLKSKQDAINFLFNRNIEVIRIAERINNLTSKDQIYSNILKEIFKIYNFNFGAILIENSGFIEYVSGFSSEDEYSQSVFKDLNLYLMDIKGYNIHPPDGSTSVAYQTNSHFAFERIPDYLHLKMTEKDRTYLEISRSPKTLVVMPILRKNKPVGIVHLLSIVDFLSLSPDDINMIKLLCSFIGTAISNSELYSVVEEQKNRLQNDLKLAKKIQESIIKIPEFKDDITVASRYIAMEGVGGDLFDVRQICDNKYSLMISDVSGHGVPAALITSLAKTSFINHTTKEKSTAKICSEINTDLIELIGNTNHYLTAFFCILDVNDMCLHYTNCGHQLPVLYQSKTGTLKTLDSNGYYLGLLDVNEYETKKIKVNYNDKILFFTDGITEGRNDQNEMYSVEKLHETFKKAARMSPDEIIIELFNDFYSFCGEENPNDDIAVMVIQIGGRE